VWASEIEALTAFRYSRSGANENINETSGDDLEDDLELQKSLGWGTRDFLYTHVVVYPEYQPIRADRS
jgi:hypothetical protein